jgi:hypothetical protein
VAKLGDSHLPCLTILHLKHCLYLNFLNLKGSSALYIACAKGHVKTATYLLANGADVNVPNYESGSTPLMQSCHYGHKKLVRLLLSCGADAGMCNNNKTTPLMRAAQEGRLEVCAELLKTKECDPNSVSPPPRARVRPSASACATESVAGGFRGVSPDNPRAKQLASAAEGRSLVALARSPLPPQKDALWLRSLRSCPLQPPSETARFRRRRTLLRCARCAARFRRRRTLFGCARCARAPSNPAEEQQQQAAFSALASLAPADGHAFFALAERFLRAGELSNSSLLLHP